MQLQPAQEAVCFLWILLLLHHLLLLRCFEPPSEEGKERREAYTPGREPNRQRGKAAKRPLDGKEAVRWQGGR
jgi:hypothetical protein